MSHKSSSTWMVAAWMAALLSGCSGIGLGSVAVGSDVPSFESQGGDAATKPSQVAYPKTGADSGAGYIDAGANTAEGNPLCGITDTTCDPDVPACQLMVDGAAPVCEPASVCDPTTDGAANANVMYQTVACRPSVSTSTTMASATCAPIGQQTEGQKCEASSDCAAGLECVTNPEEQAGVCRHYCCAGTCGKDEGDSAFCDIETIYGSTQLVPVCTRATSCSPLSTATGSDSCPTGQTCTIVEESSGQATACVTPGNAGVGQDCRTQNCMTGLACINQICQELCEPAASSSPCPGGQMCESLVSIGDGLGVCVTE
jgi:hypothetical protein